MHYESKFNQEGIEDLDPWDGEPRPLTDEITSEEVQEAVSKMRNHRSTGPDGFAAEWYKYAGAISPAILVLQFNQMFQFHEKINALTEGILIPLNKPREPRTPGKTRPIVLFNATRKIFCQILRKRVLAKMEYYLAQTQHGYRPRRSTSELTWSSQWMKAMVEKFKESYIVINTDMSEAFDRARRERLIQVLQRKVYFNEDEVRMTRALLSGITLKIRVGGILGESFTTKKGVPQGDGLSPHLFIIYMEDIDREYKSVCRIKPHSFDIKLTYADDDNYYLHKPVMDWMGPCLQDCGCARCQQQEILTRLPEVMSGANMIMNPGKTKINILERPGRRELSIKQVGSNLNPEIELKTRISKALYAMNSMSKIWLKGNPISQKTKLRLYKITVLPHLLYNIHAMALKGSELEQLNTAHRKHLRRILGIFWPNVLAVRATYRSASSRPISVDIIKQRWQFLGHILRGSRQAPAIECMRLYYSERIPRAGEDVRSLFRKTHLGHQFTSLPGIIDKEFCLLSQEKRLELTGGVVGGIERITVWGHMLKLWDIANNHRDGHGAKWKRLVEAIEEAAEKSG